MIHPAGTLTLFLCTTLLPLVGLAANVVPTKDYASELYASENGYERSTRIKREDARGIRLGETAKDYDECLKKQYSAAAEDADFSICDTQRSAYAALLPVELATLILGCFEERSVNRPRDKVSTCAALDRKLPRADRGDKK